MGSCCILSNSPLGCNCLLLFNSGQVCSVDGERMLKSGEKRGVRSQKRRQQCTELEGCTDGCLHWLVSPQKFNKLLFRGVCWLTFVMCPQVLITKDYKLNHFCEDYGDCGGVWLITNTGFLVEVLDPLDTLLVRSLLCIVFYCSIDTRDAKNKTEATHV